MSPQDWQNNLFDCSPCDSCLLSTFLPGILFGRTSYRLQNPSVEPESVNSDCALFCGIQSLTGCAWIFNMTKRKQIREAYGIEGSGMSDCCASFWCLCCALVQQEKEVKSRQVPSYEAAGYQPEKDGMHMP
ncbi:plant cadmium resistance 3 [Fusarium longipes]|uniref:Plant cadmium resistance 3 n=1 Tax=Fusarium longipes TaxID=694270 RepID=A0A395SHX4_9HYPO|nr:plant cadmium resistance 3 [Fusarium longipes]